MDLQELASSADHSDPDSRLLAAVMGAQAAFIDESNLTKSCARLLDIVISITGSAFGFIGEVFADEKNAPYLRTHSLTDISWDENSRRHYEQSLLHGLDFRNLNTLFGVTLVTGEVVVSNNPSDDPRSGGLPPGHPKLDAYLGMPILHRGELVGMIGIANRREGYSQDLVNFIQPVLNIAGSMINSERLARERATLREKLESQNKLLAAVVNNIKDSLAITDHAGNIRQVNRSFEILLGYREAELKGTALVSLFSESNRLLLQERMKKFILTGDRSLVDTRFEFEGTTKTGTTISLDLLISEIRIGNEKLFVNVMRDISEIRFVMMELEKANAKLKALSITDELTGLGNRRAFELELERSFKRARNSNGEIGLAIIDIDNFKAFNDLYGHVEGDQCLREMGKAFSSFFKRECEFVARIGGEEFAVIMTHVPANDCVNSLNGFRQSVEARHLVHKGSEHGVVTCSIGFAVNESAIKDGAALYRCADEALYEAKRNGRNQLVFAEQGRIACTKD